MESASNHPSMCRGNCGFYGSATLEGLCSVCHKDHMKKKNLQRGFSHEAESQPETKPEALQSKAFQRTVKPSVELKIEEVPKPVPEPSEAEDLNGKPEEEGKKKKNRCATCRKKVGLTGFDCRCGGLFCPAHRYSDAHDCTFDYRQLGAEEIKRNNPVIMAEKVNKI